MPSQPEQMQPVREPRQLPKKDIAAPPSLSGAEIEERGMMRCIMKHERNSNCNVGPNWSYPQDKLDEAYAKCAYITEHYAKTFFLGTQLMTPEKSRAVCAIYVWCRRTDELVDGPNADRITPEVCSNRLSYTLLVRSKASAAAETVTCSAVLFETMYSSAASAATQPHKQPTSC